VHQFEFKAIFRSPSCEAASLETIIIKDYERSLNYSVEVRESLWFVLPGVRNCSASLVGPGQWETRYTVREGDVDGFQAGLKWAESMFVGSSFSWLRVTYFNTDGGSDRGGPILPSGLGCKTSEAAPYMIKYVRDGDCLFREHPARVFEPRSLPAKKYDYYRILSTPEGGLIQGCKYGNFPPLNSTQNICGSNMVVEKITQ
jgi:hypothetical protein